MVMVLVECMAVETGAIDGGSLELPYVHTCLVGFSVYA
jgi:hypothetical protein